MIPIRSTCNGLIFFEHADFSKLYHPVNTEKYIKDTRDLTAVKDFIRNKLDDYAFKKETFNNYTPDISLSVMLSYIYKSPNQEETEKWFDEVHDFINQLTTDTKNKFSSDDEYYNHYLKTFIGNHKTENLALDGRLKELGESVVLVKSIIDEFILCRENGEQLPEPAFNLYIYIEQSNEFYFAGDNTLLSDKIDDYLENIKNRNEFIHGEIYAPVVINVIEALENAKTRMHEQRHADG